MTLPAVETCLPVAHSQDWRCIGCETPILKETVQRTGGFCIPCYRSGTFCPPPPEFQRDRRIPVNALLWSEISRESLKFSDPPREYRDKLFTCDGCGRRSVFTAEQQQEAFEVQNAFILQHRGLCNVCWLLWRNTNDEIKSCRDRWQSDKSQLINCQIFQRRWLSLLLRVPNFGHKSDRGNIAMLKRLLANYDG